MGLSSERGPDEVKLMDWIFHSKASAVTSYIWQMDAPESSLDFLAKDEKKCYTFTNKFLIQDDTMVIKDVFDLSIHDKF